MVLNQMLRGMGIHGEVSSMFLGVGDANVGARKTRMVDDDCSSNELRQF